MTEPQVWTVIGVFATAMFGMLTLMSTMFVRVLRAEIGGLKGSLEGRIDSLRSSLEGQIGSLETAMESQAASMRAEIGSCGLKLC